MKRLLFTLVAACAVFFTASAQTPAGYAIFGDKPYGYEDLRDQVQVSTDITMNGENIQSGTYTDPSTPLTFTGTGLSGGNACQNYAALSIRFKSNQILTLTDDMVIHIKIKRSDENSSGLMRISMHKNTWASGGRLTFQIANTDLTSSVSELLCAYASPLNWSWSTNGQNNLIGTQTYSGGNWNELFRFEAANGESFEITQIYIDADANTPDPVDPNECTDEDAPTGLTLAASNIQDKSVTLTASANDAASSISYEFFYKAEGDAEFTSAGTASAAPNADATKEVKGLAPETNYTFKVVATDPCNNEAEFVKPEEVRTLAFIERRYYFFRGDPASVSLPSEGVVSYDLREGVGTTVGNGGGFSHSQKKYYTNFANSNNSSWWSFNQDLSPARDMSEITQADWYLVVKFRTTITDNRFNIRLFDAGACWQVNHIDAENHKGELSIDQAGNWNTLTLPLSSAMQTLNNSKSRVFQFHSDGGAGLLDIAYAYLTNNALSVDNFADNTAPVFSSVVAGSETTSSVVLTVNASDDSGEDITYIIKEDATVLTSTPATGASGATTAITVSGLAGTDHTLTVIARDAAGNEESQNVDVSLLASDTPPHDLVVSTTHNDRSVSFTMTAEDNNAALIYAILDANNADAVLVDNIAGTSGEEKVYTLKGLSSETTYSFKVRVTDNGSNSITSDAINVTTDALSEHRFYLTRGDNTGALPSGANLTSTYVDCNVEFGNSSRDNRVSDYISAKTGDTWIAITLKPKATVENEIDDDWYIVVRFRSNLSHDVFGYNNFRLNLSNNAENWYINNSDDDKPFGHDYNDGQWVVLKKRLDSRRADSAIPASYLTANQIAVQLHVNANLVAGEFLDIDYIYFTDDITSLDEGTQTHKRVVLKEDADNAAAISSNIAVDADLQRSFVADGEYYTLCMPFDMTEEQVSNAFGSCTLAKLESSELRGADMIHLNFDYVHSIEAGVPYLFLPSADVQAPLIEGVTIDNAASTEIVTTYFTMRGIYAPTALSSGTDYFLYDGYLYAVNDNAELKAFRSYFLLSGNAPVPAPGTRARIMFNETQTPIDIDQTTVTPVAEKILRDGLIYIRRGDKVYTINGQIVK